MMLFSQVSISNIPNSFSLLEEFHRKFTWSEGRGGGRGWEECKDNEKIKII